MGRKLTEKQRLVLDYIIRYVGEHGYPPAIREIGAGLGIKSLRGVTVHLDALERKEFIKRESTSRSIQVLKIPASIEVASACLPLLRTIAAGQPLLTVENIETEISVPKAMLGSVKDAIVLRVKGDSMVDEHILDGDLAIVKLQPTADNGDLVAALLDDKATIKYFYIDGEKTMLTSADPAYQPIPLQGRDVRLIGKVIGLLRNY